MFLMSQAFDFAGWVGGPRVAFDIRLWRIGRWRNFEQEFYLLDHLVDPQLAAIDVGANEGLYAGRLAQLCPRVHCFEPIPWMAADLRKKMHANVTVHQSAASDFDGPSILRIPYRGNTQLHGTATISTENPLEEATRVESIPCQCVRIDTVVPDTVGFIKIDVEGHEMSVLHGAIELITRDRPVVLVESEKRHSSEAPENIINLMLSLNYTGIFLLDGKIKGIQGFRSKLHQPRQNLVGVSKIGTYINNFIFIPN